MNQKSGMFLWKFIGFFTVSYLILSIPFNNKPLFEYSYGVTSPATKPMYTAIKIGAVESWEATRRFTKKLFSNSIPSETVYVDSIGSKLAATGREEQKTDTKPQVETEDPYTDQEKALVEKALQNN